MQTFFTFYFLIGAVLALVTMIFGPQKKRISNRAILILGLFAWPYIIYNIYRKTKDDERMSKMQK